MTLNQHVNSGYAEKLGSTREAPGVSGLVVVLDGAGGSGPVPPGSFTYRRPDGISFYLRPTDPADTYLRP